MGMEMQVYSPKQFIEHFRFDHYAIESDGKQRPEFAKISRQLRNAIEELAKGLYEKESHFVFELLQNAEDNEYTSDSPQLNFVLLDEDPTGSPNTDGCLCVINNELGFNRANVESICQIATSTKTKVAGYIGEKGIGFKSVFLVSECPHIFSNGFQFRFAENDPDIELAYIVPYWVESLPDIVRDNSHSTCILLPLKSGKKEQIAKDLAAIAPETILFLSKLQGISLDIGPKGRTKLIRDRRDDNEVELLVTNQEGTSTAASYVLWRREFAVPDDLAEEKREGIGERTVSIAFPLGAIESPGRLFAYLPTEVKSGLPFLANADFLLSSSRESIQTDRPWNSWIRNRIAETVAEGIVWLAATDKYKYIALSFVPLQSELSAVPEFLSPLCKAVLDDLSETPVVIADEETLVCPSDARIVTQRLRRLFPLGDRPKSFFDETSFCHPKLKCSSGKLAAVGVKQFDVSDLRKCLEDEEWLKHRDIDWFVGFLAFCSTLPKSRTKWLLEKPIIPTCDGKTVAPSETVFYLADAGKREQIQDTVSSAGAPTASFIDESLYEQLANEPVVKAWLDKVVGVRPYSPSSHIADAIVPWADENAANLSSDALFRLSRLILSSWSDLDEIAQSRIRAMLPVALEDGTVVARSSIEGKELIVPRAFDKNQGWQLFLLTPDDHQHFAILADAYMTLAATDEVFKEFFKCLEVERHPDLNLLQLWMSDDWPSKYSDYLEGAFDEVQRPWTSTPRLESWMPPTFLYDEKLRKKGKHRRSFIYWLERMFKPRGDYIKNGTLKWRYYGDRHKQVVSGLFWYLSDIRWIKTTRGFRRPAETFRPSKSVKEILGNSVPYVEDKISSELCEFLGIQVEATSSAIISYLSAQSRVEKPDLATIKRLYRHLDRYGSDLEDDFATLPLIYVPTSAKRWHRSGEVVWQDLSDVFGDVYVGLSPTYGDDRLRPFFVKKLGVGESVGPEELAHAWLRLIDENDPDSDSVEAALEKIMPGVLRQVVGQDELSTWWSDFASRVQVWTLDRIFHDPESTFAGDDDYLRRKLEDRLYFVWRPPSHSHTEMRPLYDRLGIRPISEAVSIRLASLIDQKSLSEDFAIGAWSKRLLSYLVFDKSAEEFEDQIESGALRSILVACEYQVSDVRVVYEVEDQGREVTDDERVAFFDAGNSALILKNDVDKDILLDEVAESLSRAIWGRNWRRMNDSVRAILGIGNEARYKTQKDRRGWHMPKPKMVFVNELIELAGAHSPLEGSEPQDGEDDQQESAALEQEHEGVEEATAVDTNGSGVSADRPETETTPRDSEGPTASKSGRQRSTLISRGKPPISRFRGRSRSQSINKQIERSRQSRIVTYVVGEDSSPRANDPARSERTRRDHELGDKAEQYVVRLERDAGRGASQMSVNYPGYDVKSTDPDTGEVRFIEVKATRGSWGERGVELSATQYNKARERRLAYWLYVVEFADSDDPKVTRIQNPAEKATKYVFDRGWKALAAPDDSVNEKADIESTSELEELKSLTDDEKCRALIDLCEEYDLDYPEVGYDLMTEDEVVIAEAELAWPRSAVAIFLDGQLEDNEEFKSRGWTTFIGDVDRDGLIAALVG